MLNLDLLRAFIAVAESGGFTRAASMLHRSQSAVSMQIKRLEEILGVPVFDRTAANVQLNAEGEIFIEYARRIISLVDESISKVNSRKMSASIRMGSIEDYAARVLPRSLAAFWSDHPDAHIEVITGETPELLARLGTDFDLVLGMHPVGTGEGRVICRDTLHWVVGTGQSPHKLSPMPVALRPEGCMDREWALAALDYAGRSWRCAYVSSGISTLETAVQHGLAVGVFKKATIGAGVRRLGLEDGLPVLPDVEISLHVAAGTQSTRVVNLLCERLAAGLRMPG